MILFGILFMYIAVAVIAWLILYYTVKAAVKNAIIESRTYKEVQTHKSNNIIIERPINEGQVKLQQRYDKGEITFEAFQEEWNKLIS